MRAIGDLSIRTKILGGFALVLLAFLGFGASSLIALSSVQDRVQSMVSHGTPAALKSNQISDLMKQTTAELAFHLLGRDPRDAAAVSGRLGEIDRHLAELKALTPRLLELARSDERNLPAMAFANQHTNPVNIEKLQLLSALIDAELTQEIDTAAPGAPEADARRGLLADLVALRYRWLSLNNEMRLFLAFRAPHAVHNIATYKAAVVDTLAAIEGRSELLNFEQEEALASFVDGLDSFWSDLDRLLAIHQADDWRQDAFLARTQVAPLVQRIGTALDRLVDRQTAAIAAANEQIVGIYRGKRTAMIVSMVLVIVVAGTLAGLLVRGITRSLARAVEVAGRIAGGDLDNAIAVDSRDETGRLMASLDTMQRDLRQRIAADATAGAANLRIRQALDSVGVPVTLSDADNVLIYLNAAAERLFDEMETAWRREVPDFAVATLVGRPLDAILHGTELGAAFGVAPTDEQRIDGGLAGRALRLVTGPVRDTGGVYQGRVTQWIDRTDELAQRQEDQRRLHEERQAAAENLRIRIALDDVSSNVMMADKDRKIVCLNRAAQALFREAADDLRAQLPDFRPDALLGASIDAFHRHPAHQAQVLDALNATHASEVEIGARTMRIVANPVIDEHGNRLGTAVEWTDRTAEVAVEREIDALVRAAGDGDLRQRIALHGKHGFFERLAVGFNGLLDQLSGVFEQIAQVMSSMADGDLEPRIAGDFRGTFSDVKDDVNRTLDNLGKTLSQMRGAAEDVGTAAEQISAGNLQLSDRTERQASSLEDTASRLEQLTATVRTNAANAQQANQMAASARQAAQRGGEVVGDAIGAMQQIESASNRIAEIIGVIDEIAFQTNLLALNASVEAARAGEQGRGFAVVATEVRNLTSRSADAAKEIKALIQDSVDKVQTGSALVNQSGATLEEIVAGIRRVGDIVAEISAASDEQAQGIDRVNRAVGAMDELTQQNAALAEQTSAASQAMSENANRMRELVAFFRTGAPAGPRRTAWVPAGPSSARPAPPTEPVARAPTGDLAAPADPLETRAPAVRGIDPSEQAAARRGAVPPPPTGPASAVAAARVAGRPADRCGGGRRLVG